MTPEAMEKKEMLKREMQKLLNVLCDREQNVLRLHHGLNGCTPWSFEEIGNLVLELATRNKKNRIIPRHVLFGEGCHFLHYVCGGIKVVTQMLGSNPVVPPATRNLVVPPSFPDGSSSPAVKSRSCNKYNTRLEDASSVTSVILPMASESLANQRHLTRILVLWDKYWEDIVVVELNQHNQLQPALEPRP